MLTRSPAARVVAHLDALERVQRDLRAELDALAEDDLAPVHRIEQAVVADRRVVADPHAAAAQLDPRAGAERDAIAELERVVGRRPDVEDLAAAELHVLAEAQRQRSRLAAVGMDLDGRQLVEVRAVRRLEAQPAAGAPQASVEAPRPEREARSLGAQPRGARGRSDAGAVHAGIMARRGRAAARARARCRRRSPPPARRPPARRDRAAARRTPSARGARGTAARRSATTAPTARS